MHHKRHRPKHQRAGCLMCKPYKDERCKGAPEADPVAVQRANEDEDFQALAAWQHRVLVMALEQP